MKKVLVVDDQHEMFLRRFQVYMPGIEWTAIHDGEEVDTCSPEDLDVILMDGDLGFRKESGEVLVKRLRDIGFSKPIVMISSDAGSCQRGIAAGANAAYSKKVIMEDYPAFLKFLETLEG